LLGFFSMYNAIHGWMTGRTDRWMDGQVTWWKNLHKKQPQCLLLYVIVLNKMCYKICARKIAKCVNNLVRKWNSENTPLTSHPLTWKVNCSIHTPKTHLQTTHWLEQSRDDRHPNWPHELNTQISSSIWSIIYTSKWHWESTHKQWRYKWLIRLEFEWTISLQWASW